MTFAVWGRTWRLQVVCAFVAMMTCAETFAQVQSANPPELSAQQLVREAVANEAAANDNSVRHMFRSRKETAKGSQTRLYVETKDCIAAMLIAITAHPLTEKQKRCDT